MAVLAKIIAYNNNSSVTGGNDFSLNAFWGEDYKNVFYVEGDLGRSEFIDTIETEVDVTGATERTQNSSTERYIISVSIMSPLLQFLKTIDKHDVKIIQFLDSPNQPQHIIKNIDIDDTGDVLTPINLVYIKFEEETVSNSSPVVYTLDSEKLAFWDNDNDGVQDLNGEAEYIPLIPFTTIGHFQAWQLYFEADGITPATSGDVKIMVYAVNPASTPTNTVESLIGVFRGDFGDSFSDSTKWQSTQQIWNYFNVADTVGHTNRVQFDKGAFAEDNGYLSSETEDRAVDLRWDLSINSSNEESTKLSRVYIIRGGFNAFRVYDVTNRSYGITTNGKTRYKNTLNTIQDIRTTGATVVGPITVANIVATTNYSNEYLISVAPVAETNFNSGFTTKGGYLGSNFRFAENGYNFCFNFNNIAAVPQTANVLNFTSGASPYIFGLNWKYERDTTGGATFAAGGDIIGAGAAQIQLDNILVTTLPTIAPASTFVIGLNNITLPDTGLHTILLTLPTTTGQQIFNEFEVQLKPIF
jgi:hypothetical protein